MTRNTARAVGLALVLLAIAAATNADLPDAVPTRVTVLQGAPARAVHDSLLTHYGFNGAILIEKDGAVVLRAGYGWANRAKRIPFTTTTIAQIGSLTKQFTATAIADLWRQGAIDFQAPISRYLDDVPKRAADLTIEQLLTHTAGLPEACGDDFEPLTRKDLVTHCLADVELAPPGKFVYSNLGYSLLAAVVEERTGQPIEAVLRDRFFRPLHMQRTAYAFDPAWHDSLAWGFENGAAVAPISDRLARGTYWNLTGNGGMQASVEDMYTWYRALAAPSAVADSVKQVLMAPHAQREDGRRYGYGWFLKTDAAGRVEQMSHTGSDGVFFAAFVWRPADRLFYYLVTNEGEKLGANAARMVLRTFRTPAPGR